MSCAGWWLGPQFLLIPAPTNNIGSQAIRLADESAEFGGVFAPLNGSPDGDPAPILGERREEGAGRECRRKGPSASKPHNGPAWTALADSPLEGACCANCAWQLAQHTSSEC